MDCHFARKVENCAREISSYDSEKARRMRWAGHVASMGRGEVYAGVSWGSLRERDHLEDSDVDGILILRWVFSKWVLGSWAG